MNEGGGSRTEVCSQPAVLDSKWMLRIYDGIVRNERLQPANLLKAAFRESAAPNNRFVSVGLESVFEKVVSTIRRRHR